MNSLQKMTLITIGMVLTFLSIQTVSWVYHSVETKRIEAALQTEQLDIRENNAQEGKEKK